jgi:hypothetical protein
VVSVLAIGPKVRRFKRDRRRWISKCDRIRRTTSLGGKEKSSAPYGMSRKPTSMKRYTL